MPQIDGWTCRDLGTVTFQGYAPKTTQVQLEVACRNEPPDGLPWTGLDLGLTMGGAVLLLAFGALLRRVGR